MSLRCFTTCFSVSSTKPKLVFSPKDPKIAPIANDPEIKEHLIHAGDEETDHLIWCKKRLDELDGKPSVLNPIWYAGSLQTIACPL